MPLVKTKIMVGVSACLLGKCVRYDGRHKYSTLVAKDVGSVLTLLPVCPETECGLGVPREPMRLLETADGVRLITIPTRIDHTGRMETWSKKRIADLQRKKICGFIFKSRSPSCGLRSVAVYDQQGAVIRRGSGIFAALLMEKMPTIPCEEECSLADVEDMNSFIERVVTLGRFREATRARPTLEAIMRFHASSKFLIWSHHEGLMRKMGRELALLSPEEASAHVPRYEADLMKALKYQATRSKHVNVMLHALGYLRKHLEPNRYRKLLRIIEQYRQARVPLTLPLKILRLAAAKHSIQYLMDQYYLNPHPWQLKLHKCMR